MDEPASIEKAVVLFSIDDERRKRLAVNLQRARLQQRPALRIFRFGRQSDC